MAKDSAAKKVLKITASLIGTAAAIVAGAYLVGKLSSEKNDEEDSEEIRLIKLRKEEKEAAKPIQAVEEKVEEVKSVVKDALAPEKAEGLAPELAAAKEKAGAKAEAIREVVAQAAAQAEDKAAELCAETEAIKETVTEKVTAAKEKATKFEQLTAKKISSIRKQIGAMIDSMPEEKQVRMDHYVQFAAPEARDGFADKAKVAGFEVAVRGEDELVLSQECAISDRESLEEKILTLADDAAKAGGSYKGWAVKTIEK